MNADVIDVLVFFIPPLLVLTQARKRGAPTAVAVVAFYAYPLVLLTMLSAEARSLPGATMSVELATRLRAGVHLANFTLLLVGALWSRRVYLFDPRLVSFAYLSVAWMVLGALNNRGIVVEELLRAGLLTIQITNVFVLIPSLAGARLREFLAVFGRSVALMVLGVSMICAYALTVHGNYPEWSLRFGRPLDPRVLSELLFMGLAFSVVTPRIRRGALALVIAIVATGSRLSLLLAAALVFRSVLKPRKALSLLTAAFIGVTMAAALVSASIESRSPAVYFQRSSFSAGRFAMWSWAVTQVPDGWLFGIGERIVVLPDADDPPDAAVVRLHNGLLESTLSYGLLYTFFVYGVYWRFGRGLWPPIPHQDQASRAMVTAGRWLLAMVLMESLVGTSLWTNLGDGIALGTSIYLATLLRCLRRLAASDHHAWIPATPGAPPAPRPLGSTL